MSTTTDFSGQDDRTAVALDVDLEGETLLEEIQALGEIAYWRWDLRTDAVTATDRWYDSWGLQRDPDDPFDAADLGGMVHPEDREAVLDAIETTRRKRERTSITYRIRRPDGAIAWIASRFLPEVESGEVVALHGINKDVTKQEKTEDELARERSRLDEAQREAGVGSWEWDVAEDSFSWSDEQYRLLGREPGDPPEPTFATFRESVHPDDRDRVEGGMTEAREDQAFAPFEFRVEHPDESARWMEARGSVEVEDGEVVRMTGTTLDITDRVLPQRRYETVVQATSDAVMITDEEGRIAGWNDAAEGMFGWSEEEVLGELLTIIHPGEDREDESGWVRWYSEKRLVGETTEIEVRGTDGEVFPVELSLDSYTIGDAQYLCGIVRDIADRKEMEQELEEDRGRLKEAKEVAEDATDAKSRFLANTSHEIRTPLSAIIGLTDLALDGEIGEGERDRIEGVRASAEHLLSIVNDVLDVSMIEAGQLTLEKEPFEPREILERASEVVRGEVEDNRPVTLVSDVADDVPRVVLGDPTRVHRVLLNLLSNAADFTPSGSVTTRVQVADPGDQDGPTVLAFEVEDTGKGIPEEDLKQLFEPFTQVDESLSREREGVGLGLSISRDLVEMMGGTIEVESTVGEGTTFRFTMEVGSADEDSDPSATTVGSDRGSFDLDFEGDLDLRVLVAEDNAVNSKVLEGFLDRFGLEAEVAVDGEEALERVRAGDIDLVFMDLQMPVMDGHEATGCIRDEVPEEDQPRIVAVTAHASQEDRERCLEAGMDDYLSKPVRPPGIARALKEAAEAVGRGGDPAEDS